jgi:hypothetical protein
MLNNLSNKGNAIETTLKFHFTPVRMHVISNNTTTNLSKNVGKMNPYALLLLEMYISATIMESSMDVPQKTKNRCTT